MWRMSKTDNESKLQMLSVSCSRIITFLCHCSHLTMFTMISTCREKEDNEKSEIRSQLEAEARKRAAIEEQLSSIKAVSGIVLSYSTPVG